MVKCRYCKDDIKMSDFICFAGKYYYCTQAKDLVAEEKWNKEQDEGKDKDKDKIEARKKYFIKEDK